MDIRFGIGGIGRYGIEQSKIEWDIGYCAWISEMDTGYWILDVWDRRSTWMDMDIDWRSTTSKIYSSNWINITDYGHGYEMMCVLG